MTTQNSGYVSTASKSVHTPRKNVQDWTVSKTFSAFDKDLPSYPLHGQQLVNPADTSEVMYKVENMVVDSNTFFSFYFMSA